MAAEPKPIMINPDSDLGRQLRDASDGDEVRVDAGDGIYLLSVHRETRNADATEERERPSPEQVALSIEGIRKATGAWADIDGEALKAYIYERRKTANRSFHERRPRSS